MKKYLSLIIIFMAALSAGFSQSVEMAFEGDEITRINFLQGEDQNGEVFKFPQTNPKPVLIFFLPKTQSRAEAEEFLDEIRIYMKRIDNEFKNHAKRLLVVESYRSGRLVNRLFRSKMRGESFTVIRDSDSSIISEVNRDNVKILLWLIDGKGLIMHKTNQPFIDKDITRVKSQLMTLNSQNSHDNYGDEYE